MTTLLEVVAGHETRGYFELRAIGATSKIVTQRWFPLDKSARCLEVAETLQPTHDVYVGAAPRCAHGEGGRAAIERVWCLWADCDTITSLDRLQAFPLPPTFMVRSGTGSNRHAYWSLSHPLSPDWAERANRRLSYHLAADPRATDAARILRMPNTLNHKSSPPRQVVADSSHGRVYLAGEIVGHLSDPPDVRPRAVIRPDAVSDDPLLSVSADRYYATLTGREVTRGNVKCPFHGDGRERNPSMRLYETTWFCFGCQRGGSVFEFGSALWGLGTRGADFLELKARLTDALR